jgi:hypothetical protein
MEKVVMLDCGMYVAFLVQSFPWLTRSLIRSGKDANTIGNIAAVASIDWGCAVQVMAAVTIASDDAFSPNSAQLL